jgi:hypothetical protein
MVGRDDDGEIEQRARHGGHRHAAFDRALRRRQIARAVDDPARSLPDPAATRRRHLDERAAPWPDPPQSSRAAMAEDGLVADRQHGREQTALPTQLRMPDGVHATFEPQQPARRQPVVDRIRPEPEPEQLSPRHHTVLARREVLDRI